MARAGRATSNKSLRELTATFNAAWIDNNGEEHFNEVEVIEITVNDQTGFVQGYRLLTRRADLGANKSTRKGLAAIWNR
jgi:hypothetical protein